MENNEFMIQEIFEEDLTELAAFYEDNDFVLKGKETLMWKYAKNPAGQARIFVVKDSASNIKGTLSYMPRIVYSSQKGSSVLMQATDAFLAPEVRGKSLYPKLLQHSMSIIDTPIYTFPNKIAERIEIKCSWKIFSPVDSWYFPVALGGILVNTRMRFLAPVINLFSKLYAFCFLGRKSQNVKLNPVYRFEEDFNGLIKSSSGDRSANFLNWRFLDNPLKKYICYQFSYHQKTIGYCVLDIKGHSAQIYDFMVLRKQRKCLKEIVGYCRGKRLTYLIFKNTRFKLWRYGFLNLPSEGNIISHKLSKERWVFTLCDSDWD